MHNIMRHRAIWLYDYTLLVDIESGIFCVSPINIFWLQDAIEVLNNLLDERNDVSFELIDEVCCSQKYVCYKYDYNV